MPLCIYTLSDPDTAEIRYVGFTSQPLNKRLASHRYEVDNSHKARWVQKLKRAGKSPYIQMLQHTNENEWQTCEQFWIQYFKTVGCRLVNGTSGGEGGLGAIRTPEMRKKISEKNTGRRWTAEARAAMSKARRGIPKSDEWKRKARERQQGGANISPETRIKMTESKRGKKQTPEHAAKGAAARVGTKRSPETRARMVLAQKAQHAKKRALREGK